MIMFPIVNPLHLPANCEAAYLKRESALGKTEFDSSRNEKNILKSIVYPRNGDASEQQPGLIFDGNFECGNLEKVEWIRKRGSIASGCDIAEYNIYLKPDPIVSDPLSQNVKTVNKYNTGCCQWFLFRVSNIRARSYRFNICNLSKHKTGYTMHNVEDRAGTKRMGPFGVSMLHHSSYVLHGAGWRRVGESITYSPNPGSKPPSFTLSFTVSFQAEGDTAFISYGQPYFYSQLQHFLREVETDLAPNNVMVTPLCQSVAGFRCDKVLITENKEEFLMPFELLDPPAKIFPTTPRTGRVSFTAANNNSEGLFVNSNNIGVEFPSADIADDVQPEYVPPALIRIAKELEKDNLKRLKLARDKIIAEFEADYSHAKPVIVVLSRLHPGETCSSFICEGMIRFLVSKSLVAENLLKKYVFLFLPMMNPDGVVYGRSRSDCAGFDLNRVWANLDPNLHPTVFQARLLLATLRGQNRLKCVIDLHGNASAKGMLLQKYRTLSEKRERGASMSSNKPGHEANEKRERGASMSSNKPGHEANDELKDDSDDEDRDNESGSSRRNNTSNASTRTRLSQVGSAGSWHQQSSLQFMIAAGRRSRLTNVDHCSHVELCQAPISSMGSVRRYVHEDLGVSMAYTVQASSYTGASLPYSLQYLTCYDYTRYGRVLCLALTEALGEISSSTFVGEPKSVGKKYNPDSKPSTPALAPALAPAPPSGTVQQPALGLVVDSTQAVSVAIAGRKSINMRRVSHFIVADNSNSSQFVANNLVPTAAAQQEKVILTSEQLTTGINAIAVDKHRQLLHDSVVYDSDDDGRGHSMGSEYNRRTHIRWKPESEWSKFWCENECLSDGDDDVCLFPQKLRHGNDADPRCYGSVLGNTIRIAGDGAKEAIGASGTNTPASKHVVEAPIRNVEVLNPTFFHPSLAINGATIRPGSSRDKTHKKTPSISFSFQMPSQDGQFPAKSLGSKRQMLKFEIRPEEEVPVRLRADIVLPSAGYVGYSSESIVAHEIRSTRSDNFKTNELSNGEPAAVPLSTVSTAINAASAEISTKVAEGGDELYLQEIRKKFSLEKSPNRLASDENPWRAKTPTSASQYPDQNTTVNWMSNRPDSPSKQQELNLIELLNRMIQNQLQKNPVRPGNDPEVESKGEAARLGSSGIRVSSEGTYYCGFPLRSRHAAASPSYENSIESSSRPSSHAASTRPKSGQARPKSSSNSRTLRQGPSPGDTALIPGLKPQPGPQSGSMTGITGASHTIVIPNLAGLTEASIAGSLGAFAEQYYMSTNDINPEADLQLRDDILEGITISGLAVLGNYNSSIEYAPMRNTFENTVGDFMYDHKQDASMEVSGMGVKTPARDASGVSFIQSLGSKQFHWHDGTQDLSEDAINYQPAETRDKAASQRTISSKNSQASQLNLVPLTSPAVAKNASELSPRPPSAARAVSSDKKSSPRVGAAITSTFTNNSMDISRAIDVDESIIRLLSSKR